MRISICVCAFILLFSLTASGKVPELRAQKGDGAVALQLVDVSVTATVRGHLARTEFVLVYQNPEENDLRGDFLFPLPDDATVTDVGLYFDDRLRHAVVVEREQGRRVYDDIVHRRRVDPALAEWMNGNTFRLEVYPIPARGEKKIYVAYEQDLKSVERKYRYQLDFHYRETLRSLNVEISADQGSRLQGVSMQENDRGVWHREWKNQSIDFGLMVSSPPQETATALVEVDESGMTYLSLHTRVDITEQELPGTSHVLLLWDVSGSNAAARESRLLHSFLRRFIERQGKPVDVILTPFHTRVEDAITVRSVRGESGWKRLKSAILDLTPIGGTDLKRLLENIPAMVKNLPAETRVILVTDGMDSWNATDGVRKAITGLSSTAPILVLPASDTRDIGLLRSIANQTSGWTVNLQSQQDVEARVEETMRSSIRLSPHSLPPGFENVVFHSGGDGSLRISAKSRSSLTAGSISLRVLSARSETRQSIAFDVRTLPDARGMVRSSWARWRLNELLRQPGDHSQEFLGLGREYHLATPRTSLIVLETWQDYQQYGVEMPPDVKQEYERRFVTPKQAAPMRGNNTIQGRVTDDRGNALPGVTVTATSTNPLVTITGVEGQYRFDNLAAGTYAVNFSIQGFTEVRYEEIRLANSVARADVTLKPALSEEFTVMAEVPIVDTTKTGASDNFSREYVDALPAARDPWVVLDQTTGVDFDRYNVAGSESGQQGSFLARGGNDDNTIWNYDGVNATDPGALGASPTYFDYDSNEILSFSNPDQPLLILRKPRMTVVEMIHEYLRIREQFLRNKRFYRLAANVFGEQSALYTRILADMVEFSGPDTGLLRSVARDFLSREDMTAAESLLRRACALAPTEPQNLRELALVLAQAGQNREAEEKLRRILTQSLANNVGGLREIVAEELNRLLAANGKPVDLEVDESVDLKIIASWDTNFADIDLHVIEPTGEEVSYEHTSSKAGATITPDNTTGYGPEIYRIRKAPAGRFVIQLSYYAKDNTATNQDAAAYVTVQHKSKGKIVRTVYPVILQNDQQRIEVASIRM